MKSLLEQLQTWFAEQCDDHWEHGHGITIETLDNPGWSVAIDLLGTKAEKKTFIEIDRFRSEENWMKCQVIDRQFQGYGGPLNLEEIIGAFLNWVSDALPQQRV